MIAFAVVCVVVLFLQKNTSVFQNIGGNDEGLAYNTEVLGNLLEKDTDADGLLDWEESLWGTDPTKTETTPGVPDGEAVASLKLTQEKNNTLSSSGSSALGEENLTETDKFSREFFSTVATLTQSGSLDDETVGKISSSLVEQIKISASGKTFLISDIKITKDETPQSIKSYANSLVVIFTKYAIKDSAFDILSESMTNDGDIDAKILNKFDPMIQKMRAIVKEMLLVNTPQTFALLHLEVINGFQASAENLSDIKLIDEDIIIAISAISKYQENDNKLKDDVNRLSLLIDQKLSN